MYYDGLCYIILVIKQMNTTACVLGEIYIMCNNELMQTFGVCIIFDIVIKILTSILGNCIIVHEEGTLLKGTDWGNNS